jgi:hypothetical protein
MIAEQDLNELLLLLIHPPAYFKLLAYRIATLTAFITPDQTWPLSSFIEELMVIPEATDIDSFSESGVFFAASNSAAPLKMNLSNEL